MSVSFPERLKQFFPQDTIPKQIVAYCIVHGLERVANVAIDYFFSKPSLKTAELETPVTPYQFSLAHLCVIFDRKKVLNKIFETNITINQCDFNKATPFHHAAMIGNPFFMKWFSEHQGDDRAKNHRNLTPSEIFHYTHPPFQDKSKLPPILKKDLQTEQINEITSSEFIFWNSLVIDPKEMVEDWASAANIDERVLENLLKSYYENREKCPEFYLAKVINNDLAQPIHCDIGDGVFALKDIPKGRLLGEYTGEYALFKELSGPYVYLNIDGQKVGNYLSRINDSFPMVIILPLFDPKGKWKRILFYAKDDIPKNSEITINCNAFHSSKERHVELRPKALEQFAKNLKTFEVDKFCQILKEQKAIDFSILGFLEEVKYLFDTPTSLLLALCEDWISLDKLALLLKKEEFCKSVCLYDISKQSFKTIFSFNEKINLVSLPGFRKKCLLLVKDLLTRKSKTEILQILTNITIFLQTVEPIFLRQANTAQLNIQDTDNFIQVIRNNFLQ